MAKLRLKKHERGKFNVRLLNIVILLSGLGVIAACLEAYRVFQYEADLVGGLLVYVFGAGSFAAFGIIAGKKKSELLTEQSKSDDKINEIEV